MKKILKENFLLNVECESCLILFSFVQTYPSSPRPKWSFLPSLRDLIHLFLSGMVEK